MGEKPHVFLSENFTALQEDSDTMDNILSEFLTEADEYVGIVDTALASLEQDPDELEQIKNIYRLVHTIRGTCGFLGLPRLEALGHAVENVLGKIRDRELNATPDVIQIILESMDVIKYILLALDDTEEEPNGDDNDLIIRLNEVAYLSGPVEARAELIGTLEEGQTLEGVVKSIIDYGAFVDLGGVDGLLHVTDIAWRRVNHPSEALTIGETVQVQVIHLNKDTQRISLGMKQLQTDPWDSLEAKYPLQAKFTGRVTNITDYGAFVELEPGVEGLVHVSEMSWTKKNVHPGKIVSTSQEVEVMVLEVHESRRRISLGLKQCLDNPWEKFAETTPVGSTIKGEVKNITEFGLFVDLENDVAGMVHMSEIDWNEPGEKAIQSFNKGDEVSAKVLDIDIEKERISLGIKQCKNRILYGLKYERARQTKVQDERLENVVLYISSNMEKSELLSRHVSYPVYFRDNELHSEYLKNFDRKDVISEILREAELFEWRKEYLKTGILYEFLLSNSYSVFSDEDKARLLHNLSLMTLLVGDSKVGLFQMIEALELFVKSNRYQEIRATISNIASLNEFLEKPLVDDILISRLLEFNS